MTKLPVLVRLKLAKSPARLGDSIEVAGFALAADGALVSRPTFADKGGRFELTSLT
jgi:hypothetical protein